MSAAAAAHAEGPLGLAIDTTFVTRGLATPAQSCPSAVVDFVIGKNGLPLPEPMKVVKTNSLDFARVLNTRPRETPGFRTPAEAFNEHLHSLQKAGVASID